MSTGIVEFLITAFVAGIVAAAAMEAALWVIGRAGWARADMIVALGSLLTRRREHAWRVGAIVHAFSAIAFAILYTLVLMQTGYTQLPLSLAFGGAIGVIHGIIVSLALVWVVAEQHPLEEFQEAGFAIGLSHIVGHAAFGAAVGLVVGVAPM